MIINKLSLFDDDIVLVPKKIIIKKVSNAITLTPKKIIIKNKKYPYEKEINQLLNATSNRCFNIETLWKEKEMISNQLFGLSKKLEVENIVERAETILENMKNLYVGQALDFAVLGTTWTHFSFKTKPKLLLRRIS